MSTNIFSLNHASLIVANINISLVFYCEVLGLQQVDRPDLGFPGAWLQLGAQQLHLLELENPDPITGRPEHGGRDRHVALTHLRDLYQQLLIISTSYNFQFISNGTTDFFLSIIVLHLPIGSGLILKAAYSCFWRASAWVVVRR